MFGTADRFAEAGADVATADQSNDINGGGIEEIVDAASTELSLTEAAPVAAKPTPARVKAEPGFVQKISEFLFADGLWKIIAGIGALLAGGLVLLIMRRRRADEEFEISMMSIGTHTQSVDDPKTSISESMSASASEATIEGLQLLLLRKYRRN